MGVIPSPSAGTAGEESDAAPFEQQIPRRTLKRRAPRDDMSLAQASGGAGSQLRMTQQGVRPGGVARGICRSGVALPGHKRPN